VDSKSVIALPFDPGPEFLIEVITVSALRVLRQRVSKRPRTKFDRLLLSAWLSLGAFPVLVASSSYASTRTEAQPLQLLRDGHGEARASPQCAAAEAAKTPPVHDSDTAKNIKLGRYSAPTLIDLPLDSAYNG